MTEWGDIPHNVIICTINDIDIPHLEYEWGISLQFMNFLNAALIIITNVFLLTNTIFFMDIQIMYLMI